MRYQQEGGNKDNHAGNVLESISGGEDFDDPDEGSADEGVLPSHERRDDWEESTTRQVPGFLYSLNPNIIPRSSEK